MIWEDYFLSAPPPATWRCYDASYSRLLWRVRLSLAFGRGRAQKEIPQAVFGASPRPQRKYSCFCWAGQLLVWSVEGGWAGVTLASKNLRGRVDVGPLNPPKEPEGATWGGITEKKHLKWQNWLRKLFKGLKIRNFGPGSPEISIFGPTGQHLGFLYIFLDPDQVQTKVFIKTFVNGDKTVFVVDSCEPRPLPAMWEKKITRKLVRMVAWALRSGWGGGGAGKIVTPYVLAEAPLAKILKPPPPR